MRRSVLRCSRLCAECTYPVGQLGGVVCSKELFADRVQGGPDRRDLRRIRRRQLTDQRAGEMATQYLLELGHRDILFLAGPNGSSSSAGRFGGYQRALAAAGLPYSDERVFLAGKDIDGGRKVLAQALSENVKFTAPNASPRCSRFPESGSSHGAMRATSANFVSTARVRVSTIVFASAVG